MYPPFTSFLPLSLSGFQVVARIACAAVMLQTVPMGSKQRCYFGRMSFTKLQCSRCQQCGGGAMSGADAQQGNRRWCCGRSPGYGAMNENVLVGENMAWLVVDGAATRMQTNRKRVACVLEQEGSEGLHVRGVGWEPSVQIGSVKWTGWIRAVERQLERDRVK
ncbi:hypothetical protein DFH08DRAFT_811521 [Mycena albidolilacea]|uniref:Uncharacterized protein n=1 Tax=Mycena albidolilacea TaxID=1033008 RepID=A0AAD6ZWI7_9AGAR|nr:hypothetical protein DFH08DRAFT_811521 [Mycena albidolilacea]